MSVSKRFGLIINANPRRGPVSRYVGTRKGVGGIAKKNGIRQRAEFIVRTPQGLGLDVQSCKCPLPCIAVSLSETRKIALSVKSVFGSTVVGVRFLRTRYSTRLRNSVFARNLHTLLPSLTLKTKYLSLRKRVKKKKKPPSQFWSCSPCMVYVRNGYWLLDVSSAFGVLLD